MHTKCTTWVCDCTVIWIAILHVRENFGVLGVYSGWTHNSDKICRKEKKKKNHLCHSLWIYWHHFLLSYLLPDLTISSKLPLKFSSDSLRSPSQLRGLKWFCPPPIMFLIEANREQRVSHCQLHLIGTAARLAPGSLKIMGKVSCVYLSNCSASDLTSSTQKV